MELQAIDGNVVIYQPDENYNGNDAIGFKAYDGQYNSELATALLTINPINDAPVSIRN